LIERRRNERRRDGTVRARDGRKRRAMVAAAAGDEEERAARARGSDIGFDHIIASPSPSSSNDHHSARASIESDLFLNTARARDAQLESFSSSSAASIETCAPSSSVPPLRPITKY
jgi:hypothetical protein